jgi:hypothetical protein
MPGRAVIVMALIAGHPTCAPCLIRKAGIESEAALQAIVERIQSSVVVHREHGRCRDCGSMTTVIYVTQPRV